MADDGTPVLTVRIRTLPEAVVVAAVGDLDLGTAPMLRARARAALDGGPGALIVDLGGIAFCGSAGLQVIAELVAATAAADLPFAVVADRRPVLRTLRLSHLDATLALYPTLAGARAWLRERPSV
ncbi:anti-sigma factor antagonist [Amycolatopsis balhimycina DSM 5908]|uniref:Anti-sigma factor antagonist n=1 Tax=Amycolatopsis balhimycina DSM 5908 TaxID=1081091 RepID=A0A428WDA5_AMYBA|nr:STAS domain-containing protein [Amycolatopsis balhimycina]RSM41064.1 anti-sigma factor antagonist [Amycolatopsis balhimycina DSM 5908]